MKKLVISRNEQGKIVESYIDMSQQEIDELPQSTEPTPITYPTNAIVADRATGEPYSLFVENGIFNSIALEEDNG